MSEKLRRATTAVFFVFFSVVLYLQFVKPVASLSFFVCMSLYVIVASFVTYLAIKRLEKMQERKRAMHVKLTGQRMTEEEATKALCQFNTCFVSLLSLERCGLISVPPILIEKFANLSSLNLRDNMLTSLEGLSALTTLRILNCSKNQISTLPIDFDRLRRLQYLNLGENPLPASFDRVCSGVKEVQLMLKEASDYFARSPRAKRAVVCLMAIKKYAPEANVWRKVPRDVVLIVARLVFESRHDQVWALKGKRKIIGV